MHIQPPKESLQKFSNVLLNQNLDFFELKNTIDEMKEWLWEISGLDQEDEGISNNIQLEMGYAIGPKWAGMCLEDMLRTRVFTKGIYEVVLEKRQAQPNKPVQLFYIGPGPFATLILPLLSRFSPSELQLELLEVNKTSIESAKRIFNSLDAWEYVKEIHHADALKFEFSEKHREIDLVVVECLQHALLRESQVAIAYHVLPQLQKDIVMIPEDITLHLAALDYKKKMDASNTSHYAQALNTIFSLNKQSILQKCDEKDGDHLQFPEVFTPFENIENLQGKSLAVTTEICVYKNHKLEIDESGLTVPMILTQFNEKVNHKGIRTRYVLDESPYIWSELVS